MLNQVFNGDKKVQIKAMPLSNLHNNRFNNFDNSLNKKTSFSN